MTDEDVDGIPAELRKNIFQRRAEFSLSAIAQDLKFICCYTKKPTITEKVDIISKNMSNNEKILREQRLTWTESYNIAHRNS